MCTWRWREDLDILSVFNSVIHSSRVPEEIQQSKGEESPASGGEGGHGRHLCQSGRGQQSNFPAAAKPDGTSSCCFRVLD